MENNMLNWYGDVIHVGVTDGLSEYYRDRRKEEIQEDRNEVVEISENSDDAEESNTLRSGKPTHTVKRH
jgi:hypothetical protein